MPINAKRSYLLCELVFQDAKKSKNFPWYKRYFDTICNCGLASATDLMNCLDYDTRFLKKNIKAFIATFLAHSGHNISIDTTALDNTIERSSSCEKQLAALEATIARRRLQYSIFSVVKNVLFFTLLLILFCVMIGYVRDSTATRNITYSVANELPFTFIDRRFFYQRNSTSGASIISHTQTREFAQNESLGNCSVFATQRSNCSSNGIACAVMHDRAFLQLIICLVMIFIITVFRLLFSLLGAVAGGLDCLTKRLGKIKGRLASMAFHIELLKDLKAQAQKVADISVCKKDLFTQSYYKFLQARRIKI